MNSPDETLRGFLGRRILELRLPVTLASPEEALALLSAFAHPRAESFEACLRDMATAELQCLLPAAAEADLASVARETVLLLAEYGRQIGVGVNRALLSMPPQGTVVAHVPNFGIVFGERRDDHSSTFFTLSDEGRTTAAQYAVCHVWGAPQPHVQIRTVTLPHP